MESANSHQHHQLQDHVVGSSSSSATPYYGVGTTTHAWSTTPSFLNINNGFTSYPSEPILLHSRDSRHQENTLLSSQYISNMAPDLGFHNWAANTTPDFTTNPSVQAEQLSRIKEEFSYHYYHGKNTNLLTSNHQHSSNTDDEQSLRTNERRINQLQPNDFFTMKKNINPIPPRDLLYSRGFGQIFPSMNASNLNNRMGLTNDAGGCNLDMNLEALDLLTSSSFSGNLGTCSPNQIGILRDGFSNNYNGAFDDRMQQSHQIPLYGSNEIRASISNGAVEAKRGSTRMEVKAPPPLENATKKSRLEARASCPPFKVRKEKLGDRVAALQQLVAPFGKTDTASVLMEAIGYIKFLQDQVETLSVPYMKASRNKFNRTIKGDEDEESKHDLRSRGLCLVPVSCLSYISEGGAAAIWPPPHFGGHT